MNAIVPASKVLVVCYSRTGTTRALAHALATRLRADVEEIRSGPIGVLRALADTVFGCDVSVGGTLKDVMAYDVVVIGTPVWMGTLSAPVRAWIVANRRRLRHIACFSTQILRHETNTFRDMARLTGKQPVARCAITGQTSAQDERRLIDNFVERIERKLVRIDNLKWAA
ncbi:flavodoxin [Caballeronia novacaledonica]|uniref:Flavodoxin n=1 Tax=Caballeronia novacaledonica TaxID=1544861 RepID=A0A2U3I617_9BURK|nr:NAD(P)H-dependent oxidoreductase [Caballeronia novacaledonica]SPB15547.1 flavodoxin [Caballeronia novacaledonica]